MSELSDNEIAIEALKIRDKMQRDQYLQEVCWGDTQRIERVKEMILGD